MVPNASYEAFDFEGGAKKHFFQCKNGGGWKKRKERRPNEFRF